MVGQVLRVGALVLARAATMKGGRDVTLACGLESQAWRRTPAC
jgi:hypothetical protein